jgi:Holliday junction resolvase
MPNKNKALGLATERALVKKAVSRSIPARKKPLSGALPDDPGDVALGPAEELLVECKVRAVHLSPRGGRMITLDLDWLDDVTKKAQRTGAEHAVVMFRPKNSPRLLFLVEGEFLLDLLRSSLAVDFQVAET